MSQDLFAAEEEDLGAGSIGAARAADAEESNSHMVACDVLGEDVVEVCDFV